MSRESDRHDECFAERDCLLVSYAGAPSVGRDEKVPRRGEEVRTLDDCNIFSDCNLSEY